MAIAKGNVRLEVTLSKKVHDHLEGLAEHTGLSKSELVQVLVEEKIRLVNPSPKEIFSAETLTEWEAQNGVIEG